MFNFPLRRNYTTGWHTLRRDDAINGLISHLSKRNGVKNIWVESCVPSQLDGDKGYEMRVSYQENLDETFGFPENLDKVIFLDIDSFLLPYNVEKIAFDTKAGIVITTPSLKDEYYDVGNLFPKSLAELIENSSKSNVQIVGITPSISGMQDYGMSSSEMVRYSISRYLDEHPSIKKFIIVNREEMQGLSHNVFIGKDISWSDEERARDILNGRVLVKKKSSSLDNKWKI